MQISPINLYFINKNQNKQLNKYPNLKRVECDTVSFGMKKNDFKGIDRFVLMQFNMNPQQYRTEDDFREDCQARANAKWMCDYSSTSKDEITEQRKNILNEWKEYLHNENTEYKPSGELLIIDGITKELKKDNDTIPPVLNKRILADTMDYLSQNQDRANEISFYKVYQNKLRVFLFGDEDNGNISDGWIIIPSKSRDPKNFESNVKKLQALSHKSWCTKSDKAAPYLEKGDFHIYYENSKPKLGVRFEGNEVQEIQGERNDSKIPVKYYDMAEKYIKDHKFGMSYKTQKEFFDSLELKEKIDDILNNKLQGKKPKKCSAEEILTACGMNVEQDENDGLYTLSHYNEWICEDYTLEDLGADMEKIYSLLKKTKKIEKDANFHNTQVADLSKLQHIGGKANFRNTIITEIPNLQSIGRDADFYESAISNLKELESIGGDANFDSSLISNLSKLKSIGGCANFEYTNVEDLSKLFYIGGMAKFSNSQVKDLSSLQTVRGNAIFDYSRVTDLFSLEYVGGSLNLLFSKIRLLPNLKECKLGVYNGENIQNKEELIKKGINFVSP